MVCLRFLLALIFFTLLAPGSHAQLLPLPEAPQPVATILADRAPLSVDAAASTPVETEYSSSAPLASPSGFNFPTEPLQIAQTQQDASHGEPAHQGRLSGVPLDANGNPIPLERQQPHRILGFMPNFRTVSAGAAVHPPGWKYNFTVATHQALDYSTFLFLGLTSLTAEGLDSHPSLHKGVGGFYAYTWRGFLDKTDGTYLSAWLLPSLLHEDTRYYPLGSGHPIVERALYVISREAVSKTYGGHNTPAFATLGGKVLTQYISRFYYPTSSEGFSVLATKFGYSVMRDVGFSAIREFYPDIAAHYIRKHREKVARLAAQGATSSPAAPN
jgi:hypothetical protein